MKQVFVNGGRSPLGARLAGGLVLAWAACAGAADGPMRVSVTVQMECDGSGGAPAVVAPVATTPAVVAPVAPQPEEVRPAEPPPPPEPPAAESAEPRRLVRYFCRLWKDEEYEAMWWAMTETYRREVPLEKFVALFASDAERTGGLKDENIVVPDKDEGKFCTVTVDLRFNFVRARDRSVKAVVEKTRKGYRLRKSGLVPLDLNDL